MVDSKPTAIDLFCGAGGFSLGLERAGVDVLAGVDKWADALNTHSINLPSKTVHSDLSAEKPWEILGRGSINSDEIDIIVGGPPCQSFSLAGLRKKNDERGQLVHNYFSWIDYVRPETFLMENVKGILSKEDGEVIEELIERAKKMGYSVECKVLNSAEFGVPQKRERVFIQGTRHGVPVWPSPTHGSDGQHRVRTTADVLGHDAFNEEGEPYKQSSNGNESYQVNGWRPMRYTVEPAYTVVSDVASLYPHDFEGDESLGREEARVRRLTLEEMAGLQSFPDWYEFCGKTLTSKRKQIGNAVPPRLAENLGRSLKKVVA